MSAAMDSPATANDIEAVLRARRQPFEAVVIGGSAGSWEPIAGLLSGLPGKYPLPLIIVLHVHPEQSEYFAAHFSRHCALPTGHAWDKAPIRPGEVTFAPPGYHLLVEWDKTFSLSADEKVCFSRPSIDVLFESAASVYGPGLVAVLLSGASHDGTAGMLRVRELGGMNVLQDPKTAQHPMMPLSALEKVSPDLVLSLDAIGALLERLPFLPLKSPPSADWKHTDGTQ